MQPAALPRANDPAMGRTCQQLNTARHHPRLPFPGCPIIGLLPENGRRQSRTPAHRQNPPKTTLTRHRSFSDEDHWVAGSNHDLLHAWRQHVHPRPPVQVTVLTRPCAATSVRVRCGTSVLAARAADHGSGYFAHGGEPAQSLCFFGQVLDRIPQRGSALGGQAGQDPSPDQCPDRHPGLGRDPLDLGELLSRQTY